MIKKRIILFLTVTFFLAICSFSGTSASAKSKLYNGVPNFWRHKVLVSDRTFPEKLTVGIDGKEVPTHLRLFFGQSDFGEFSGQTIVAYAVYLTTNNQKLDGVSDMFDRLNFPYTDFVHYKYKVIGKNTYRIYGSYDYIVKKVGNKYSLKLKGGNDPVYSRFKNWVHVGSCSLVSREKSVSMAPGYNLRFDVSYHGKVVFGDNSHGGYKK